MQDPLAIAPSRSTIVNMAASESAFLSSDVTLNIKLLVRDLNGSMPEMVEGAGDADDKPLSYAGSLAQRTPSAAARRWDAPWILCRSTRPPIT